MGRLSRHKKVKSFDPFYKGPREVDVSSNTPVTPSELDSQPVPQKAKHLFQLVRKNERKGKRIFEKDGKGSKLKPYLQKREGETKKEYYQRLDKQAAEEVAQVLVKERHVSQKRKEFLKARKEKSRQKRRNINAKNHLDFAKDNVKFGEVVNEPPSLTCKPRRRNVKDDTKSRTKVHSLLLQSKLKATKQEQRLQHGHETQHRSKKRKHMSATEQQISDKRRLEAIVAYRDLKKKREVVEKT